MAPTSEQRKAYARRYYQEHKEQTKQTKRAYYLRNRDKVIQYSKEWHRNNPDAAERSRRAQILKKYGVDQAWYDARLAEQDNKCAICRLEFKRRPNIDHNHSTNKARALLCAGCNLGIASIESPKYKAYLAYLEEHTSDDTELGPAAVGGQQGTGVDQQERAEQGPGL